MKIPILGMDPSLNNWGLAFSYLDLDTGIMDDPEITIVSPKKIKNKQIRVNSKDLIIAEELSSVIIPLAQKAKVIFAEMPVGSQTARAMASYGVCIGIVGAIRALGIPVMEVNALDVKLALTGDKYATKTKMIDEAVKLYPNSNFPMRNGKITLKTEHAADAIGSIFAGVRTQEFQNLMRLFKSM